MNDNELPLDWFTSIPYDGTSIREENVRHPISWITYRWARFHYMWIRPFTNKENKND